jgi:hypothetical protein
MRPRNSPPPARIGFGSHILRFPRRNHHSAPLRLEVHIASPIFLVDRHCRLAQDLNIPRRKRRRLEFDVVDLHDTGTQEFSHKGRGRCVIYYSLRWVNNSTLVRRGVLNTANPTGWSLCLPSSPGKQTMIHSLLAPVVFPLQRLASSIGTRWLFEYCRQILGVGGFR